MPSTPPGGSLERLDRLGGTRSPAGLDRFLAPFTPLRRRPPPGRVRRAPRLGFRPGPRARAAGRSGLQAWAGVQSWQRHDVDTAALDGDLAGVVLAAHGEPTVAAEGAEVRIGTGIAHHVAILDHPRVGEVALDELLLGAVGRAGAAPDMGVVLDVHADLVVILKAALVEQLDAGPALDAAALVQAKVHAIDAEVTRAIVLVDQDAGTAVLTLRAAEQVHGADHGTAACVHEVQACAQVVLGADVEPATLEDVASAGQRRHAAETLQPQRAQLGVDQPSVLRPGVDHQSAVLATTAQHGEIGDDHAARADVVQALVHDEAQRRRIACNARSDLVMVAV